jgi:DNA polymerase-3 subunit gamma/tau
MTLLRMLAFQPGDAPAAVPGRINSRARKPVEPSSVRQTANAEVAASAEPTDWMGIVDTLAIDGAARQLAENCALESRTPFELALSLDQRNEHLLTEQLKSRLLNALEDRLGKGLKVRFTIREQAGETVAVRDAKRAEQNMQQARTTIQSDPNVQELVDLFGAKVDPESIQPAPADNKGS